MKRYLPLIGYLLFALGMVFLWGIFCAFYFHPGLLLVLLLTWVYGWLLYVYLEYLHIRQQEVGQILLAATECQAPLAPALWSYVAERPHGMERRFWIGTLLFILLPGYYWAYYRRHDFDLRVAQVATHLQEGMPLLDALVLTPGVVTRPTLLAVALGEATGQMAASLRQIASRRERGDFWEPIMRLLYPVLIGVAVLGFAAWWLIFVGPRFNCILAAFSVPSLSTWEDEIVPWIQDLPLMLLKAAILLGIGLVVCFFTRGYPLWYLSRIYRTRLRSLVLHMLGLLLRSGQTLPASLQMLIQSEAFVWFVQRRLIRCQRLAVQGRPLAECLYRAGLATSASVALIGSAERMQRVPWALEELGLYMESDWQQRLRRLGAWLFPVLILFAGGMVAVVAVSTLYPMIIILIELSV